MKEIDWTTFITGSCQDGKHDRCTGCACECHKQPRMPRREPVAETTSGRYQAGEFAILGYSADDQRVLITLTGSTWYHGDEERAAGDYCSWYEPTTDEQSAEYQRLVAQVALAQADEAAAREHIQQSKEFQVGQRAFFSALFGEDDEPTGSALVAAAPEVSVEIVTKPSRFAPLPAGYAVAQNESGRYVIIHNGQVMTKVYKSGKIRIRTYSRKSSARRFIRQHVA